MSKPLHKLAFLAASMALSALAQAHYRPQDVTVEVIDQNGASFSQMPVRSDSKGYRAYLQAERGARYRIRLTNRTADRVGVVVAVDGRNIISGARSDLERGEPMYILGAWDSEEYSGWRTSLADVHEFYFTEWQDSYAEAFGDRSARGVIAVAVYREKENLAMLREQERRARSDRQSSVVPAPPAADASGNSASEQSAAKAERRSEPGTGYGDRRDEPAVRVAFEAQSRASSKVFLKYEWRETLCARRIVDCADSGNRFWPDSLSFAPAPPRPGRFE